MEQPVKKPTKAERAQAWKNNKRKINHKPRKPRLRNGPRRDNVGHPVPIPTAVPRFASDDPAAYLEYLDANGYVVIADVLSPDQLHTGRSLAWDFIESRPQNKAQRNDPLTWTDELGWPDPYGNGIIVGDGAGHCEFQWFVRGVPAVQQVYKNIWNTEELITSFDGFCMFRPAEYNESWRTGTGWYHIDQNGNTKPDKMCVQGFVNFYDAGLTDGGLCVVPKSPTIFKTLFEDPDYVKMGDFVRMKESVWTKEAAELRPIKVCAKAGDMVLWDSRTIHCNAAPTDVLSLSLSLSLSPSPQAFPCK
eukprot:TRINITY_DN9496_c1_g1_i1.p1 TRINITY_DN9496_c1_g1~~TRINITY_DN9496_c1_g1_i1.p1  ORF type:complete len:316 (-),score=43.19 TRINITY_DN9496_c1_g1_i1:1092-2006(-)